MINKEVIVKLKNCGRKKKYYRLYWAKQRVGEK